MLLEYRYTIRGSRTVLLDLPKAMLISTAHTARGERIPLRDGNRHVYSTDRRIRTHISAVVRSRCVFIEDPRQLADCLGHSSFSPPLSLDYGDANAPPFIVALSQ